MKTRREKRTALRAKRADIRASNLSYGLRNKREVRRAIKKLYTQPQPLYTNRIISYFSTEAR